MASDNHTTIVGNLVEDPEVRFTNTGIAVTNLRVAVTQRIQQDGQWRDGDTSFFKVNVWRGQAENLAESLTKGDRVMVTGGCASVAGRPPKGRSGRSPSWRLTRSAPRSSGPRPRSSGPASAATASAAPVVCGSPSGAATSTTRRPLKDLIHSVSALDKPGALDFGDRQKRIWSDRIFIRDQQPSAMLSGLSAGRATP
jgi:single-stranded DNA-binding protein